MAYPDEFEGFMVTDRDHWTHFKRMTVRPPELQRSKALRLPN